MIALLDTYMVKHILISAILIGLYQICYRKHHSDLLFNRGYLLLALALSIVLPHVSIDAFPQYSNLQLAVPVVEVTSTRTLSSASEGLSLYHIYMAIAFLFLAISILRFYKTTLTLRKLHRLSLEGKYDGPACSFLGYMAIPDYTDRIVVEHESYHVAALHSLDRVVLAVAHSLLWINPILFIYRKLLIENHEYAADQHSISVNSLEPKAYATHLVRTTESTKAATLNFFAPLSHQYESLILNRIQMLRNKSTLSLTSKLALIPIVLIVFSAFTLRPYQVISVDTTMIDFAVADTLPKNMIRTDTTVVMNFDTNEEQTMVVKSASQSLENYLQSLTYSGEVINVTDTITTIDFDTYEEKVTLKTYSYPAEIDALIRAANYGDVDIIVKTANDIAKSKK